MFLHSIIPLEHLSQRVTSAGSCTASSTLSGLIIIIFEEVILLEAALPLLLAKVPDCLRNTGLFKDGSHRYWGVNGLKELQRFVGLHFSTCDESESK